MKKYIALCLWSLCWSFAAEAADSFRAIPKEAYPSEDSMSAGVRPNVLLLLDTGSSMVFIPTGILPNKNDGRTESMRRQLIDKGATYGSGARPYSEYRKELTDAASQRYGRDLLPENNIIGDPNCYYSPYVDKPYFLTFRDVNLAKWNGQGNPPKGTMPAELITYLPGRANAGKPVPPKYNDYLVPNDSRMYQMKLALWRLLGADNAETFAGMRVGMAISYKEDHYPFRNFAADFYFNPVKGTWPVRGPAWTGAGTSATDGNTAFNGVRVAFYDDSPSSANWVQVNRARMMAPFDYIYKQNVAANGAITYTPTSNLRRFLENIDGIEEGNGDYIENYELFADGKTPLATSIFSRHLLSQRQDTKGYSAIVFAANFSYNYADVKVRLGFGRDQNKTYIFFRHFRVSENPNAQPDFRAGDALGSAIDFFSPPPAALPFVSKDSAQEINTLGYFPVVGSCQPNWLIVFTAADDSDGGYTAADAATRLFNTSKEGMRGRHWDGRAWLERTFVMDSGIRTLVVGMIDPNTNDPNVGRVKQSLNALARAGNPVAVRDSSGKEVYVPNPNAEAYFATDVAGMIASLGSILTQLTSRPFASGSPSVLSVPTDDNQKVLFSSSYRINAMDQWDSWFRKLVISGDVEATEAWEFNKEKLVPYGGSRRVYTFAHASGDVRTDVQPLNSMPGNTVESLAGIPRGKAQDFTAWLREYNRTQLLGDMENSEPRIVGMPESETLSNDASVAGRKHVVYLQTNRGVLHAVDYENGDELWAFIPPNVFQTRLKALKFDPQGNWYNGDGVNSVKSLPHDLLSGPLVARDVSVNFNASDYRTILIGNLGWGGNGLYAVDATTPSGTPRFLWAVDNDRYDGSPSKKVAFWGKNAASQRGGYEKLGLTVAPAAFLWAAVSASDKTDVVFLPGGMGYGLGQDDHGRAFYAISPLDGAILKVFEENSGFKGPNTSRLGMGIAPVTIFEDENRRNTGLVTADSEGNVLYCDTTSKLDDWELKSVFQLRGSDGKPVSIPKALAAGMTAGNQTWLYGASSELQAPGKDANGQQRGIFNAQNYIFGFNLTKTSADAELTIADAGMKALTYIKDASSSMPPYGSASPSGGGPKASALKGWYLALRPKLSTAKSETLQEYVTTPPYLYGGTLYVSTFIPKVRAVKEDEACPDLGYSKIYALDPLTGGGRWKDDAGRRGAQAMLVKNVKITGVTILDGRMYVSVKPLKSSALNDLPLQLSDRKHILQDETQWSFKLPEYEEQALPTIDTDTPYIQYWRDIVNS
ncbi:MAG: hypothetical protein LBQ42_06605 [Synergistaceae bacterium]|nr:hypothetical protein [Synergistaceae bacterium]